MTTGEHREEAHEDVAINSDVVQEEISTLIRVKFGNEAWNPRKVDVWVDDIIESTLKNLADMKKPFKYIVNCVIMQRTGAGISTGFISLWDNTLDGVVHVPYENDTIHCLVTVGMTCCCRFVCPLRRPPALLPSTRCCARLFHSPFTSCDTPDGANPSARVDATTCSQPPLTAFSTAARALAAASGREVRAELLRDARDGVCAVPPLSPRGWAVRHPSGCHYFLLTRRPDDAAGRRYQSVHDRFRRAGRTNPPEGETPKEKRKRTGGVAYDGAGHAVWRADAPFRPSSSRAAPKVTVFAPFRVCDPSLRADPVDVCEWAAFDVLIRKAAGPALWVRLASVNGALRLRAVQLLARAAAEALVTHAFCGRAEPNMMELMRRRRQEPVSTRRVPWMRRYDDALDGTGATSVGGDGVEGSGGPMGREGEAYELLTECFDLGGEYGRALCYGGPYISALSREMAEALREYVQGDLGLSAEVCEYICQMQFFLEQEEYMTWLGQIKHVAENAAPPTWVKGEGEGKEEGKEEGEGEDEE